MSINRQISKIKPTNEIQRLPRSLDSIAFYKASEYRAWMLFYGLPILSNFLPAEYTHHLSLLVSSLHIIFSDCIYQEDLDIAHSLLSTFYESTGRLYSDSIYTANMHSLIHTVPLVQLWGPLWAYSMFGFENLNGYISTTFHGTQRIVFQISFNIQLLQTLPDKLEELSASESTQEYIKNLFSNNKNMLEIGEHTYALGKIRSHQLTTDELTIISSSGIDLHGETVGQSFD